MRAGVYFRRMWDTAGAHASSWLHTRGSVAFRAAILHSAAHSCLRRHIDPADLLSSLTSFYFRKHWYCARATCCCTLDSDLHCCMRYNSALQRNTCDKAVAEFLQVPDCVQAQSATRI